MLIALGGISQTSNDTICLPIADAKKAIVLIEKGKVVQEELDLTKKSLELSNSRIQVKDSLINLFLVKEQAYKSIFENYKKSIANSEEVVANLEKSLTLERRRARRQGLMKWVGMAAGFGIGYLIVK